MNFSEFVSQTSGIVKYSPNGDLVAIAKTFEVKIFETNSLRPMHSYTFIDVVSHLEWSYDSNMIMVGIAKRALVFVKSLHDSDWQCKIDEGMAGLANCRWGPLTNHIITVSEFKLRLTVWCLADKSVQYIKSPKHDDRGISFSQNKKLMALAQRSQDGRDQIGIYDVIKNTWECLYHFYPDTFDLEDLQFAGDGQHLLVWDSNLKCKLLVYQIQFSQNGILACQQVAKFIPYENTALGIRSLQVSKNNQYIMAGYFDQKVRFYNQLSWKEIFAFDHSLTELTDENTPKDLNIYSEAESRGGTVYEILQKPYKVPTLQVHQQQVKGELPRIGISLIAISSDSKFVATKNEQCPNLVWIWDIQRLSLNTVMIQRNEVQGLSWCPMTPTLNISTGNGKIYLWTVKVASVCQIPVDKDNFSVFSCLWNPNGKSFASLDKNGLVFQKYIYSHNAVWNWIRGFLPIKERASRLVAPYQDRNLKYIWRNSYLDGYKIGLAYLDQPLDLSNFLLIRTRERLLLENKVRSPSNVMKGGKALKFTQDLTEKSLTKCKEELQSTLPYLHKILYVTTQAHDFPVAFASNTLYVLERNGQGNKEDYEKVLLPVLRKKGEYLHGEGVAQVAWALANAEIWDKQVWDLLKNKIENNEYKYEIVKNERWSTGYFQTYSGREHFMQSELTQFAQQLFFKDHLNLFELYNGLLKANSLNKDLGLENTIKKFEATYSDILPRNNDFREIEKTLHEENQRIAQNSGNKALNF